MMMNNILAAETMAPDIGYGVQGQPLRPTGTDTHSAAQPKVVWHGTRGEIRHCDGHPCKLSALQTALLSCLARKAGTPVSRDELLMQVWQLDPRRTATRRIDMQISQLRKQLGDDADQPVALVTVHGVGYMLRSCVLLPNDALDPRSQSDSESNKAGLSCRNGLKREQPCQH